jgi:hypothetical protein
MTRDGAEEPTEGATRSNNNNQHPPFGFGFAVCRADADTVYLIPAGTAGSPLVFLRVMFFSWTHYWAKIFETSPIDCILLGV